MSKFDTYIKEDVFSKSLIRQGDKINLYMYISILIMNFHILDDIFTINKIIFKIISGTGLLILLTTFYLGFKYRRIINQISPNSEVSFYKSKITFKDDSKEIDVEATDIKKIILKRRVLKDVNSNKYRFAIIDIECKRAKHKELIIDTISKDEDKHDLFHTLEVFASFNRISYRNEIKSS